MKRTISAIPTSVSREAVANLRLGDWLRHDGDWAN